MRKMIAIIPVVLLLGCTPQQRDLADALIPAAVSIANVAVPGIAPIMTAAATLACVVQADANLLPPSPLQSRISTAAGMACTW